MRPLRDVLNECNANKLPSAGQALKLGNAIALCPMFITGTVTSHLLALPTTQKAIAVLFAFAQAGASTGQKTPIATGAAPAAGQVGVSPTGDIQFNAADAVTSADVVYMSAEGEIFTETLPVAANVATPLQDKRALILLSATAVTGGTVGAKTVDFRAAALAATEAGVTLTGTIGFAAADAVTSATVTYIAKPGVGVAAAPVAELLATDIAL